MNVEKTANAMTPWKDRASFSAVPMLDVVFALIALVACALGVALYANEQISFFVLLVLFVYTVRAMRSMGNTALLLVTALAASLLTASLSGAAVVLSLIIGAGTLAWLLTLGKHPYLPVLCLLVSAAIAFALTKNVLYALLALSFLPAGILLAIATLTHQRRTTVICFGIGGFLISIAIPAVVWLFRTCGTLDPGVLREYLETLHTDAVNGLLYLRDALLNYLETSLGADGVYSAKDIAAVVEELRATADEATLRGVVTTLFGVAPALAVIACSILSFNAQLLQGSMYRNIGWKQVLTRQASVFTMSVSAAILYDVGFIIMLFFGASSVFGVAMQNLCLMILPGFCVIGWGTLLGTLHRSRMGARILWLVLLAVLVCFSGMLAPFLLALWGTNAVIMAAIHIRMLKKMSETLSDADRKDGQDDNDDNDTE